MALHVFTELEDAICSYDGQLACSMLLARVRRSKGSALANLHRDEEASACFLHALEGMKPVASVERQRSLIQASLERSMGAMHLNAARCRDALSHFQKALEVLKANDQECSQQQAWTLRCVAEAYVMEGRGEEALASCSDALKVYDSVAAADSLGAAWIHRTIGRARASLQHWEMAAEELLKAWVILEVREAQDSSEASGLLRDLYMLGLSWPGGPLSRADDATADAGTLAIEANEEDRAIINIAALAPNAPVESAAIRLRALCAACELPGSYRMPFGYSD
eukprot:gnl/TRDRNA2_/TRDRNA2_74261_c1_seq1.p1 gnl/TRDRNA2_/TRDRNA2_74261_c1~~gnl/TRDRNA2_/TRDRNA2_74261_c1_seq1.p1  ORF type:complete len:281 (-),score=59.06 gnl/TRDRNA2_/TRDRNA2_74261_c1_seq1:24-866(-)